VEATQWFKHGDYPGDDYYDEDYVPEEGDTLCCVCRLPMKFHGGIEVWGACSECVCPSNWIVQLSDGYVAVMNDKEFHEMYEEA